MKYTIILEKKAEKYLYKIPAKIRENIRERIRALANNPHPHYAASMQGYKDLYKFRVGDYRIIYTVRHSQLIVMVIDIEHRSKVYKQL